MNTKTLMAATLSALTGLTLITGSADAGVWASTSWTGDSDLTLSASTTYTHAVSFISDGTEGTLGTETIAGVTFETYEQQIWNTSAKSGTGWSATAVSGLLYSWDDGFAGAPSDTESDKLAAFPSGSLLVVAGDVYDITLTGLATNTDYIFTVYSAISDGNVRTATFDGSDDGFGTTTQSISEDNTIRTYSYNSGNSTTFTLRVTGTESNYAFPAFTNELVPEPSSLALLGVGGLLIARRRRQA